MPIFHDRKALGRLLSADKILASSSAMFFDYLAAVRLNGESKAMNTLYADIENWLEKSPESHCTRPPQPNINDNHSY